MTEYWVSQGNKWCEFCKIFISSNPATIRNHELGQRHKDNVTNRISEMRKEKAAKQKEEQATARALEQIEAKAKRSYQKDVASFQETREAHASSLNDKDSGQDWEYDSSSGYYVSQETGIYYDPNSGFYYSDVLGKWVTRDEAFSAAQKCKDPKKKGTLQKPFLSSGAAGQVKEQKDCDGSVAGAASGPVVSQPLNPTRSVKGATSTVAVQKRKREEERKPKKAVSAEEQAAIKAREAARKRVEEREKSLLGLYGR